MLCSILFSHTGYELQVEPIDVLFVPVSTSLQGCERSPTSSPAVRNYSEILRLYIYMYTIGLYPPAHWLTYAMYHISLIREIEWNWRRWHPNNHVPALRSSRRVSFQMNYKKLGGGHPKCDGKLGHHWRTELLKTRSTIKPKIIWSGRM
mgnify:CR=1 FL=1